ncbi:MAG: bifunctional riboflavin kinase/FAD synthetase [Bacteroidales bacterium]|nr:bifunctional riboflavin kinase/FAD synthetase [Bacteroidales bacterium]
MEIFYGIDDFAKRCKCATCVAVGTFDGLHMGHRLIVERLVYTARSNNLKSVILTFDPHPRKVLFPDRGLNLILSPEEKVEVLSTTGIDYLVVHRFDKNFASLKSEDFMRKVMVDKLGMRHLVSGFNNHFGCDRMGDVEVLKQYGQRFGFEVSRLDAAMLNGISASSTLVRNALLDGNVEEAASILGYSYYISGTVVHGRHIGTQIGFPTANISPDCVDKLIPKAGVYAAELQVDGALYKSVVNIGENPTVSDSGVTTIEAYILDFEGDIYSKNVRVFLYRRIRDQKKFSDLEQLALAIKNDIAEVKKA